MIKTYKYKLYHSKNDDNLDQQIKIACFIYNHCLQLKKRYYQRFNKGLNYFQLCKHVTKLKKLDKYNFFKKVDAQVIQEVLERLEKSFEAFFNHKGKYPKLKSHEFFSSITFKQTGYKLLEDNKVRIKKKIYRYFKSRPLGGDIKRVSIKRDSLGDYYICFTCLVMDRPKSESAITKTAHRCGFDFGLKTFLTCSGGTKIESPLYLHKSLKELKKKSKQLSSKQKGSNNRKRAKLDLARLHKKIHNQRRDFLMKLSLNLVRKYDELYFEDLNLKGMQKLWGRKVSDLSFSDFINFLEYRCSEYDKKLIKIDRWFPSSKKCSVCGYINNELKLSDRSWICPDCFTNHDRDLNASINIYEAGSSASGVDQISLDSFNKESSIDC